MKNNYIFILYLLKRIILMEKQQNSHEQYSETYNLKENPKLNINIQMNANQNKNKLELFKKKLYNMNYFDNNDETNYLYPSSK